MESQWHKKLSKTRNGLSQIIRIGPVVCQCLFMDCSLAIVSKYSKYMFYQVFAAILHLIMGHGNLM